MLYIFKLYTSENTLILRKTKEYATYKNAVKYGIPWAFKSYTPYSFKSDFGIVYPDFIPVKATVEEAF